MPTRPISSPPALPRVRLPFRRVVVLITLLACAAVSAGAQCTGLGAPTTTQTKCDTAIGIPGNPLKAFDISWVNPDRAEYYLADRSNKGVDIIDTRHKKFKKTIVGNDVNGVFVDFVGFTGNNNTSGPDGVVSHGKWLYAGDGDSTLKVIDLDTGKIVASLSTGGSTRVDEMALTTDGKMLLVANNAEDPPFATLFTANGDDESNSVSKIIKIDVDQSIIPSGSGLSIEQPAWDPETKRFYASIPTIAENPAGCQLAGPTTCSGGLLVTDPLAPTSTEGAYDPATNTGVIKLNACGPNGATVGPHDNLLLGCTPANLPSGTTTLVINATTHNYAQVAGITGSDEVWFNKGDDRYYTGSSAMPGGAVLGVIDGTSVLIETIRQSSRSHSVAADSKRNLIFVPQGAPGTGGDTSVDPTNGGKTVGEGICGTTNGCIAVYASPRTKDEDDEEGDNSGDHK